MSGVFVFAVLILYVVSCAAAIPGADPTGVKDSAEALNAYLRKLCTEDNPSKLRPHAVRAPRIVVLDLASGIYRLDSPLLFNHNVSCTGPVLVRQGTLLAGAGLRSDRFLVEAVEYIGERLVGMTLTFDRVVFASNFTGGGLLVNKSSFTTVSNCNFLNFETFGIWTSGADFRLDRSVLMECTAGMANCEGPQLKATAMYIKGADSHFNRNVVACTHIGFVNADGDNMYHQNHIWTNCHPPQDDTGVGDYNLLGFLVSGGTPQIDGGAIDNCHLRITSYRGAVVTNMHFNGISKLILAAPDKPPQPPVATDTRCQYWRGAMCSLRVTNNFFTCRGSLSSNHGPGASCGAIWANYTPPQAQQIDIYNNAWENSTSAVCTHRQACTGADCASLFGPCATTHDVQHGPCATRDVGPCATTHNVQHGPCATTHDVQHGPCATHDVQHDGLDARWRASAEQVCRQHGMTLRALGQLPEQDRAEALYEAGLSAVERARVLAALE